MLNNNRIVFLTLGLLLSPAGYGEDPVSLAIDTGLWKLTPSTKLSFGSDPMLLADRPIVTTSSVPSETVDSLDATTDFEFQDINELKRMSKLRSLSLLTLAEFNRTRLFLGVDTTGVVGLHFGGARASHSDRHLEIARMPYLKNEENKETDVTSKSSEPDVSPNLD